MRVNSEGVKFLLVLFCFVLFVCFACRFTPVPDSVIKSAMLSGESVNVLDSRQQVRHANKTCVKYFQPLHNSTLSNSSKLSMANV